MSKYVLQPNAQKTLPVAGTDQLFPVSQLYCVGRNYADHAIEMGHDPDREAPFFFMKPAYAVLSEGGSLKYPALTEDLHHEVELVVALKAGGQDISVDDASELIYGYAVGLDLTRRDLQGEAKEKGRPWDSGKTFLHAAPCSAIMPVSQSGLLDQGAITLSVNGENRQSGDLNQMIWKIPEIISKLSELFLLQPGDLIFTGTPAGVAPVVAGDHLMASIPGVGEMQVDVS